MSEHIIKYTVKTKQAKYGKALLTATYIKSGKEILAKIFPPHDQVDRFVVLIPGYSNEPIETFYAMDMKDAFEVIQKVFQNSISKGNKDILVKMELKK